MTTSMTASPRVEMLGVSKSFPGVRALDSVDLTLHPGEVHALLGENGAGKSTLIKILTGALECDRGDIRLEGRPVSFRTTGEAQASGISTVYQEVNLIPAMSVTKNLTLERTGGRLGFVSWRRAREQAREKLQRLKLDINIEQSVGSYSVAIQQLVAIARALDDDTKVLVLDEPTASLDAQETETLFGIIRDLKARGIAVVFITHFLDQVYEISDRISVLRNGSLVATKPTSELPPQDLVAMMIGRELGDVEAAFTKSERKAPGAEKVVARNLGKKRMLEPFDLVLRAGEVVGLAGLLGSGRTETAKLIFGAIRHDSGSLSVRGTEIRGNSPRRALDAGIAFCPEDRKTEGLVGELSIRENIVLTMQAKGGWLRRIPHRDQERLADEMIKALAIATPDAEKPVGQLSGGNQQKVVLARALASKPEVLLLDEPTRGIDVGAHAEIIVLIRALCDEGLALLVASSELDEIVAASDRVAVLRDRQKIGELSGEAINHENIIRMIAGGGADHE
ncbi:sugar ABC transporter ATP-binding protein [Rhodospirillaceae bacterium KN72]|uniref:Sugar ABC transporter ATP-binding protein n=1 Tax=Pacificispira spongiicola TaxID=2729598 RepID=A0A7Y0DXZ1_9PROT|nr:sugar ABC transporter ATP-binding protein [Pacificispira spongiicola]NMM43662.1 sugar ABC transporter ATP-binding protein [Pacificispira spongiicola]